MSRRAVAVGALLIALAGCGDKAPAASSTPQRASSAETRTGFDAQRIYEDEAAGADDLSTAIARVRPGETVDVEIHRGGETKVVKVELEERPAATG